MSPRDLLGAEAHLTLVGVEELGQKFFRHARAIVLYDKQVVVPLSLVHLAQSDRLEQGNVSMEIKPFDLCQTIETCVSPFHQIFDNGHAQAGPRDLLGAEAHLTLVGVPPNC